MPVLWQNLKTENTTYFRYKTWRNWAETELEASFLRTNFHVPEVALQAVREESCPGCKASEQQQRKKITRYGKVQQWHLHDGVNHICLILRLIQLEGNHVEHCKLSQLPMSGEVMDCMENLLMLLFLSL